MCKPHFAQLAVHLNLGAGRSAGVDAVNAALADPVAYALKPGEDLCGPLTVTSQVTNSYGTSTAVTRKVYISTACAAGETKCARFGTLTCSCLGTCLHPSATAILSNASGTTTSAAGGTSSGSGRGSNVMGATPSTYTVREDASSHVITVLGAPPQHVRTVAPSTGELTVITIGVTGSAYVDAGATAYDSVDHNVTGKIAAMGLKQVMAALLASCATPAKAPSIIRYSVADSPSNESEPGARRVHFK